MGVAGFKPLQPLALRRWGEEEWMEQEGSHRLWLVMNGTHLTHKWETCLRVIV